MNNKSLQTSTSSRSLARPELPPSLRPRSWDKNHLRKEMLKWRRETGRKLAGNQWNIWGVQSLKFVSQFHYENKIFCKIPMNSETEYVLFKIGSSEFSIASKLLLLRPSIPSWRPPAAGGSASHWSVWPWPGGVTSPSHLVTLTTHFASQGFIYIPSCVHMKPFSIISLYY